MREQGKEQSETSPSMAAAAAAASSYHPESQVPAGHAQMGLEHDFHHHGAQQSMMFGDTSFLNFDPSSHEQIQLSPYDFSPDDKSANIFNAATFNPHNGANGTINPSTLAPTQAALHKTSHMNNNRMPFTTQSNHLTGQQSQQQQQQQQQPPNMSAADYTAANTIHNFRSTPTQHYSQPDASVGVPSWGSFLMPNPPPSSMGLDMHFQHHNAQSPAGAPRHGSFTSSRNVMYFQGIPQQVPSSQIQRHYSVDSSSQYLQDQHQRQWTESQSPSAAFAGHTRPSTVSFGSDPLFDTGHYRNTTPSQQDKSGNLLNIPYSSQAVQAGLRQKSVSAPSSQPNGSNSQPLRRGDNEPARKRRKSQAEREEELEWMPDVAASKSNVDESGEEAGGDCQSFKRRKPSVSRVPPIASPKAAEDEAARRGVKKPRETLTEHQKRQHHIQSEKKRREIINQGYSDLNVLVPCLNGGKSGLSRSECLQESASYIETLMNGSEHIMKLLGITEADVAAAQPSPSIKPEGDAFGT